MKKLIIVIFIFSSLIIGCNNPIKNIDKTSRTNIYLLNDFSNFQKQMSESDTILVWMNLSLCLHQGMEKFIVSKAKDSLNILLFYKESAFSDKKYIEKKTIRISENDTTWNFDKFLSKNKFRMKSNDEALQNFQYR